MKAIPVLIIVVSTHSCALDNVDGAEVMRIPMATVDECEAAASLIDPRMRIRAYCEGAYNG